jgi:hypothetical protein
MTQAGARYTVYMDMKGASFGGGAIWWSELSRQEVRDLLGEWGVDPALRPGQEIWRDTAPYWVRVSDKYRPERNQ